jgi:hypothetical protein
MGGIGHLPGTLHDRSVQIRLIRAKPGEIVSRFDSRHTEQETEIRRKLTRWAQDNFAALKEADPVLPDGAYNRVADNWRPLFAVAEVAGGNWPARAASAFRALTASDDLNAHGLGTTLLGDIRQLFRAANVEKLSSAELVERLAALEGHPWAEYGKTGKPISKHQLARALARFDIQPRTIRIGDATSKGYHFDQLHESFDRFLPPIDPPDRNVVTVSEKPGGVSVFETSQLIPSLRIENVAQPPQAGICDGVTDEALVMAGKDGVRL